MSRPSPLVSWTVAAGPGRVCLVLVLLAVGLPDDARAQSSDGARDGITLASAQAQDRDRAVRLARDGRYDEALAILRRLLDEAPRDVGLRGDLAAVLSWSGRDAEAVEAGARLPFVELEPMVAEAVARSARNLTRPGLAVEIYRQVLPRHPQRLESQIGLALAYLEWGEIGEAQLRASILLDRFPSEPEAHVAAGHVYRAVGRVDDALARYGEARRLDPGHPEANRQEALLLEERGRLDAALALVQARPQAFDPDERARLHAEVGARMVRDGDPGALAFLDEALQSLRPDQGGSHRLRIRFDRVQVLLDRSEAASVLAEVRALEAEGVTLPPYVARAAADALRASGRDGEALDRYLAVTVDWPDDFRSRQAAFHLLVDEGRFDEADALMEDYLARQPGDVSAQVTRAMGLALAGDLSRAQGRLEALAEAHPHAAEVRLELATVYRWRGWPHRALATYEDVLLGDPLNHTAQVGRVSSLLDLGRRGEARTALDALRASVPDHRDTYGLASRFRVDGLWEVAMDGAGARSTGGELGTRDHRLTTRLVSPPLGDRLRFRVATTREDARFDEATGVHDRIAVGAELRAGPVLVQFAGSGSRQGERHPGVGGELLIEPGDRLSVFASGASHSVQVPLRAVPTGVRGWDLRAGLGWRAHEARSWRIQAGVVDMTDGNRRLDGHGLVQQALLRRGAGGLAFHLEGYGVTNERSDVPYFSPSRLASAAASLAWDHLVWRGGEGRLRQEVTLTGGAVAQSGEDTLPIAALRVDHDWAPGPRLSLRYGARWGSPVYDGDRERRLSAHAGFTWRLP